MLYGFNNYREWLSEELRLRRERNPSYSLSSFAKKLDVSPALLSLLLNGRRKLSKKLMEKIALKLELDEKQKQYLGLLVKVTDAQSPQEEKLLQNALESIRSENQVTELSLELFEVISRWEYSAILECLQLDNLPSRPRDIAEYLGIENEVASSCLKKLVALELASFDGSYYRRCKEEALMTPNDIKSAGLQRFHLQALELAKRAIIQQNPKDRNVSGITMAVDPARLPEAKKRIQQFSKELLDYLEGGRREKVYQLAIQLFELKNYPEDT